MRRRRTGFTLVEILVVLSLLGVLMGLSIGFVQRWGKGNLLLQTSNSLANLLAAARAQSYGTDRAYVALETGPGGETQFRSFRNRQVFHWPCEDFVKASEEGILTQAGGVEIVDSSDAGREGRYAAFTSGGTVDLGARPWLQFVDGFSLECRLRIDAETSRTNMMLFEKGNALQVKIVGADEGRFDIEAKIRLAKDAQGEGGGDYGVRTGMRIESATGRFEMPEWDAPLLAGRWYEVKIAYDRNALTIHVDDRLRALRSDRRNRMVPNDASFRIGGGFAGAFDSLVIGGIFEDDDDRFDVPEQVVWIAKDGKPRAGPLYIHFANRVLDPRHHAGPVRLYFELASGKEGERGQRRAIEVTMSGETFVRAAGEE